MFSLTAGDRLRIILSVVFFSSGMTALTLQTVWNKILGQTIGTDHLSSTAIVSIFMLGLGLGSQLGSVVARRTRSPMLWFAGFEAFVALYGAATLVLLRLVPAWSLAVTSGTLGAGALATDFLLNLAVLIIPTVLMGASLPLVVQAVQKGLPAGTTVGYFYAINICGAIFGCLLSGYVLIGTFGLTATCLTATVINLSLALTALVLGRGIGRMPAPELPRPEGTTYGLFSSLAADKTTALISFIAGFVALGYQMVYFRVAVYYFSATSYVFPSVLASYLALMFAGTLYAGRRLKNPENLDRLVRISLTGTIATTPIVFIIPYLIRTKHLVVNQMSSFLDLLGCLSASLIMMVPVAFISMMFPAIVQRLSNVGNVEPGSLGARTGYAYLVQTMGNFLGALICGFIILPSIGALNTAYLLCALVCVIAALHTFSALQPGRRLRYIAPLLAALAVFAVAYPSGYTDKVTYKKLTPRLSEELEGTAFIYDDPDGNGARINMGSEPATSYNSFDQEWMVWPADSALALLGRPPEKILIIGIGPGHQAEVLHRLYPEAHIEIVELLDVVIREMRANGSPMLNDTLDHAVVTITDGRRYVTKLGKEQKGTYDYVQIGVFHSTSSGAGNLFTRDFLKQVKQMMKPDGVLTFNAYLPAVQASESLFETVIVASHGPDAVADVFLSDVALETGGEFMARYIKTQEDIRRILASRPGLLLNPELPAGAFFVWDREKLKSVVHRINAQSDDLPVTEYFLNNRVYYDFKDPRVWPTYPADMFGKDIKHAF